jgi:hypothetical protein
MIMKSFVQSFALNFCSGMYRNYQFLAKMKALLLVKLLDSLRRNDAGAELCSGEFRVAWIVPILHTAEGHMQPS